MAKHGHSELSRQRLHDFIEQYGLYAPQTYGTKLANDRLYTRSNELNHSQIDYVLVSKHYQATARVLQSIAEEIKKSDHRIVLAEVMVTNFLSSDLHSPDRRITNVGWSCTEEKELVKFKQECTREIKNKDNIDVIQEKINMTIKQVNSTNRAKRNKEDGGESKTLHEIKKNGNCGSKKK